jgi:hypothetical protein
MTTNITQAHRDAFHALVSGDFVNFALLSCFVNGEAASAIIAVNRDGEDYMLTPLFVSVTDGMILTDHEGVRVSLCCGATGCTPDGRSKA